MHVLIIGGTGTISRAIVRTLLHSGHRVTIYNRGQRVDPPPSDVEVIIGDRRDRPTFEATLQQRTFDVAIDMISFNADDAASSLRALPNVGHFIHTSTVMTYGPPLLPSTRTPMHHSTGVMMVGMVLAKWLQTSC